MTIDKARETALKILFEINEKGAYSNITVNKYLENTDLRDIDRGFITELVYGTIKWKLAIDWVIRSFSSIKFNKISPWILNILRLGVYQLLYTDRIPASAACNESVTLSRKYGHGGSSGFVNAVLRNVARNKEHIDYPDPEKDLVGFLSVKYSHPEWMVSEWLKRFGRDFTEGLLDSNNQVPELCARANTLKIPPQGLINALREQNIDAQPGHYMEEAVFLKNSPPIAHLDLYRRGCFQIQDESSMLVGRILDPKPGQLVVDVCSAPGGKATHLAQLMNDRGQIIARDVHEHKLRLIEDAVKRLGLSIVKTELFDATLVDTLLVGKADCVLVDAPCTGLGILRRKPDIKWARNREDKEEIIRLQQKILDISAKYVKPGGTLVYSTCTIETEENDDRVRKFLEEHPEFAPADIRGQLPEALLPYYSENGTIQLFPNVHGSDGFFIAKLIRKG